MRRREWIGGRDERYDSAAKSFRNDMRGYKVYMRKAKKDLGLSRGTYEEALAAKNKFSEEHDKTTSDLNNLLKGKKEGLREAESLNYSSDAKIRDIRTARRNLAIAGAVGLGYGIYRWRKNRKKKKEEEEMNKYPISRN